MEKLCRKYIIKKKYIINIYNKYINICLNRRTYITYINIDRYDIYLYFFVI